MSKGKVGSALKMSNSDELVGGRGRELPPAIGGQDFRLAIDDWRGEPRPRGPGMTQLVDVGSAMGLLALRGVVESFSVAPSGLNACIASVTGPFRACRYPHLCGGFLVVTVAHGDPWTCSETIGTHDVPAQRAEIRQPWAKRGAATRRPGFRACGGPKPQRGATIFDIACCAPLGLGLSMHHYPGRRDPKGSLCPAPRWGLISQCIITRGDATPRGRSAPGFRI